jgi:hypothetical protein
MKYYLLLITLLIPISCANTNPETDIQSVLKRLSAEWVSTGFPTDLGFNVLPNRRGDIDIGPTPEQKVLFDKYVIEILKIENGKYLLHEHLHHKIENYDKYYNKNFPSEFMVQFHLSGIVK